MIADTPLNRGTSGDRDVSWPNALVRALLVIERVYDNIHRLADEGIIEFDSLDLRPAITILRSLLEEHR
jgi:hypothetical protein